MQEKYQLHHCKASLELELVLHAVFLEVTSLQTEFSIHLIVINCLSSMFLNSTQN